MSGPVKSLRELAARGVVGHQLPAIGLPPELIEYLHVIDGTLGLDEAQALDAHYREIMSIWGALDDDDVNAPDVIEQLVDAYAKMEEEYNRVRAALVTAMNIAQDLQDQAWKDYLIPTLADASERNELLGTMIRGELDELLQVQQQ